MDAEARPVSAPDYCCERVLQQEGLSNVRLCLSFGSVALSVVTVRGVS